MGQSDFLVRNKTCLEIVFLDFVIQHHVYLTRISQVPTFTVSACHALGLRMARSIICPSIAFASTYSLGRIASQLSLEALSLKGTSQWPTDSRSTLYMLRYLTCTRLNTRGPSNVLTCCRGFPRQDFHLLATASFAWRTSSRPTY